MGIAQRKSNAWSLHKILEFCGNIHLYFAHGISVMLPPSVRSGLAWMAYTIRKEVCFSARQNNWLSNQVIETIKKWATFRVCNSLGVVLGLFGDYIFNMFILLVTVDTKVCVFHTVFFFWLFPFAFINIVYFILVLSILPGQLLLLRYTNYVHLLPYTRENGDVWCYFNSVGLHEL